MIHKKRVVLTTRVFYYLPDYPNLIQEFLWQVEDIHPDLLRLHKFLNYWHKNIDVVINSVEVSHSVS